MLTSVSPRNLKRIQTAAEFSGQTVEAFALSWIFAGVRACEDDYIMHDGEIVGDELAIDALANECLAQSADAGDAVRVPNRASLLD